MKKNIVTTLLLVLILPAVAVGGGILFREKYAGWIALCVAVLSCLPLFYSFERKEASSKELTVLAVLIALSAAGRLIFAWLPGFKPITALTMIAALWLGKEAGFAVGALAAVLSNFYFGQGPWTPFQMFAWGIIGFLAGLLAKPLKKSKILLCLFGVAAGLLYSATMDIWVTVWEQGGFNLPRYGAALLTSLPLTAEYAVSNVIFLLLLTKPIGEKLERIKIKYGLFKKEEKR